MTTSCHLTKAPEMKYIDECYQSQPTLPSYRAEGEEWGREGIGLHVVIRSSVLITKLASLPPGLSLPPLQPPHEGESVTQRRVYNAAANEFKVNRQQGVSLHQETSSDELDYSEVTD